jgi:hypothetical protein
LSLLLIILRLQTPPRQVIDDDIVLIRVRAAVFDSDVGRRNDTRVRPILMVVVTSSIWEITTHEFPPNP